MAKKTSKQSTSQSTEKKFLQPGRVVIILQGRYAGKKAVIIKSFDEGSASRPYGHAIVAGIDRNAQRVVRKHTNAQIEQRVRMSYFLKVVNYQHLMPTRYGVDVNFSNFVTKKVLEDPTQKTAALKKIRKSFSKRYLAGKNKWFFTKLRF
eukprot:CAMPEP_0117451168 /NCGR_PEP_ID=MMETSP0759-20121206/8865_1 /TAXON_ID=63605 /ORGANISM="Percolomonas cosmopolitus, Strain WS" /LENGTH=149 /DNA_ID=CAMNT_0005243753 /DNA_START=21 /DNA_END=470 /DNA_ORIENTATION=-